MNIPDTIKSVTRTGNGRNRIIFLPQAWIRDRGDPDEIHMVVGNLILISAKEDSDTLTKAVDCLVQAGVFKLLDRTGLEIVRAE